MTRKRRTIRIPVDVGEDYQTGLLRRLEEYGITQREVCQEMGIHETQFSRWVARPSPDTGKAYAIRIDNVIKIEQAILNIRRRKEREKYHKQDSKKRE